MNSFASLCILFLILILLAVILIYLQHTEFFRDLISPSPHGTNINNNSSNYQFVNKSPYKHFLRQPEEEYLGWDKWWSLFQQKSCVQKQNYPSMFSNFLKNKPLKYDGIWEKDTQGDYYTWKLKV